MQLSGPSMNIQQLSLAFLTGAVFILAVYHSTRAAFVHRRFDRHAYFAMTCLGGVLFLISELFLSSPLPDETALMFHRLKMAGYFPVACGIICCVYDLTFPRSRVPKVFQIWSAILIVTIPSDLFLSMPVRRIVVEFAGSSFAYSFGRPRLFYSANVLFLIVVIAMTLAKFATGRLPWKLKIGASLGLMPLILGAFNDFWVSHGLFRNILLSPYFVTCFLSVMFMFFLWEDQQTWRGLIDSNRRLDEKIALLEASERRATEANRAKSLFLSTMSHELRTPLNSIIGFSEVLEAKHAATFDEKSRKFLGNIQRSGQHLLFLINAILDISKIEAGTMELSLEPVAVPELVETVRSMAEKGAEKKRIAIELDVSPDVPRLTADSGALRRILLNLLSNAVKFSPDGSKVTLVAKGCGNGGGPGDCSGVVFEVVDRGIGIAPTDQEAIFEAFRQVDTGTNRRFEGAGLGLTLVRQLVGLHGGKVEVDSDLGRGSTFRVVLPVTRPAMAEVGSGPLVH
jgi:signal transduction histidine kinase